MAHTPGGESGNKTMPPGNRKKQAPLSSHNKCCDFIGNHDTEENTVFYSAVEARFGTIGSMKNPIQKESTRWLKEK